MSKFELMAILRPDMLETDIDKLMDSISKKIKEAAGVVIESSKWGKKHLAYEIKGYTQGYYILIIFKVNELLESDLNSMVADNPDVIRFMLIHDDKTIYQ